MEEAWFLLWAAAFRDTVLVETPIYAFFLYRSVGIWQSLILSLGLQLTTHPVLWLLWPEVSRHVPYEPLLVIAETLVVFSEAALVAFAMGRGTPLRRRFGWALLTSFVANAASTIFGLVT